MYDIPRADAAIGLKLEVFAEEVQAMNIDERREILGVLDHRARAVQSELRRIQARLHVVNSLLNQSTLDEMPGYLDGVL